MRLAFLIFLVLANVATGATITSLYSGLSLPSGTIVAFTTNSVDSFNPTNVAGLKLWLDAQQSVSRMTLRLMSGQI